ncbi:MAG: 16S rRNA (uracil(1498)-N(3))-methyltransferase [Muribaculaceae bacterium]|nr:16S rRNA (uracil(1498)-N(3))-methyltransferase [Muribaculaceae bacterium]
MIQFFSPDIAETLTLPVSDSRHAVRVLRMDVGDELQVVDGRGNLYNCRLADAHSKHAAIEIVSVERHPLPWQQRLAVAVAPTKHLDRMEWMVEKMTEIGVNDIIPLLCRRSERRELKTERLEKIAVSAMKQSLKAVCPTVWPLTPFKEIISFMPEGQRFMAYCDPSIPRVDMATVCQPRRDTLILIGPEGDFDPTEIRSALDSGFTPVTLGDNRLRTETAALYSLTIPHIIDSLHVVD